MRVDRAATGCRAVVLVEGESDRAALLALARRRGRTLAADGVVVVPMGGATNLGHHLRHTTARPGSTSGWLPV